GSRCDGAGDLHDDHQGAGRIEAGPDSGVWPRPSDRPEPGFDVRHDRTGTRVVSARLRTVTLGCKVNQYETQLVREGLLRSGFVDAAESEPADVCIVNTCTVTAEGDAKSRQAIRRLHRRNPHARIVVMGCYATRAP